MSYIVPSIRITQEFSQIPVYTQSPLSVLIIGLGSTSSPAVSTTSIGYTTSAAGALTDLGTGDVATNPLALGVKYALLNAGNNAVYYVSVTAETADGFNAALALAEKSAKYYAIVPVFSTSVIESDRVSIRSAITAHVNKMSTALSTNASPTKWRVAWYSPAMPAHGSGGSGDTGSASRTTAYIAALPTNSDTDPNTGLRRLHNVFPSVWQDGDTVLDGCFLACACAALRSASVPHQPLTNAQIIGPAGTNALTMVTSTFTEDDLNNMAPAGVWIITQDLAQGGGAYTRDQLTADNTLNLNYTNDSITANVDSISFQLQDALAPFRGKYNISPGSVLKVRAVCDSKLAELVGTGSATYTESAGSQLIDYKIITIAQDANYKDKLNANISLSVPYAMNNISVQLGI